MIRLPSLPFASSIVGGEQHAELLFDNDTMFSLKYYANLYNAHKYDIPRVLTEKLTKVLDSFANNAHDDLAVAMFERLMSLGESGIICKPILYMDDGVTHYETIAYHCNEENDTLDVVSSFRIANGADSIDKPFLAFSVERAECSDGLGFSFYDEVNIPIMVKCGWSRENIDRSAWHRLKYISVVEAIFAYKIIDFKEYSYDAMLHKNGECLNPNFVKMNLLALEDEKVLH